MGKPLSIILLFAVIVSIGWRNPSPVPSIPDSLQPSGQHEDPTKGSRQPDEIIAVIERGISRSDLESFTQYFSRQVFISLRNGESGYFSNNQAAFVVEDFFKSRRVLHFKFTTIHTDAEPFATGGGLFLQKGNRETLQVYVALSKPDDRWLITQFNVY